MGNTKKPRVFYVPNEAGVGRQVGVRRGLTNLRTAGLISDLKIFSLELRISLGGDPEGHRQDFIRAVNEFQPDFLLIQHPGATGLSDHHMLQIRQGNDFFLLLHEGDPHMQFFKPLPHSTREIGRHSDVVFTVGGGSFIRSFERAGAKEIKSLPHVFDPARSGPPSSPSHERKNLVVMIANRGTGLVRRPPGTQGRIQLVELLQSEFGVDFSIYGSGWNGSSARGPLDFDKQSDELHNSWMSANWDHFSTTPMYFSDRLPIALASGSIHATTYHRGYDELFGDVPFLLSERTPRRLLHSMKSFFANTSEKERLEIEVRAAKFSEQNFRQENQIVEMLNHFGAVISGEEAFMSWNLEEEPNWEV
jgi:hypothetical protein